MSDKVPEIVYVVLWQHPNYKKWSVYGLYKNYFTAQKKKYELEKLPGTSSMVEGGFFLVED